MKRRAMEKLLALLLALCLLLGSVAALAEADVEESTEDGTFKVDVKDDASFIEVITMDNGGVTVTVDETEHEPEDADVDSVEVDAKGLVTDTRSPSVDIADAGNADITVTVDSVTNESSVSGASGVIVAKEGGEATTDTLNVTNDIEVHGNGDDENQESTGVNMQGGASSSNINVEVGGKIDVEDKGGSATGVNAVSDGSASVFNVTAEEGIEVKGSHEAVGVFSDTETTTVPSETGSDLTVKGNVTVEADADENRKATGVKAVSIGDAEQQGGSPSAVHVTGDVTARANGGKEAVEAGTATGINVQTGDYGAVKVDVTGDVKAESQAENVGGTATGVKVGRADEASILDSGTATVRVTGDVTAEVKTSEDAGKQDGSEAVGIRVETEPGQSHIDVDVTGDVTAKGGRSVGVSVDAVSTTAVAVEVGLDDSTAPPANQDASDGGDDGPRSVDIFVDGTVSGEETAIELTGVLDAKGGKTILDLGGVLVTVWKATADGKTDSVSQAKVKRSASDDPAFLMKDNAPGEDDNEIMTAVKSALKGAVQYIVRVLDEDQQDASDKKMTLRGVTLDKGTAKYTANEGDKDLEKDYSVAHEEDKVYFTVDKKDDEDLLGVYYNYQDDEAVFVSADDLKEDKDKGFFLTMARGGAMWLAAKLQHVRHSWDDGVVTEPNCTKGGYTTYTCTICGETKIEDETDVTDDHDWGEPTYTWSEDNATVTAQRVCKNDASHVEKETAKVTSEVTKQPTTEEMGETTYTAKFENEAFVTQTKTLADIDKLTPDPHLVSVAFAPAVSGCKAQIDVKGGALTDYRVPVNADYGSTVTLAFTPATGYQIDKVRAVDANGKSVSVSGKGGRYTLTMRGSDVKVTAALKFAPTVTAPKARDLTYNGQQQELVYPGTTNAGWLEYAFAPDVGERFTPKEGDYSKNIPTRDIGRECYVWYRAVDAYGNKTENKMVPALIEYLPVIVRAVNKEKTYDGTPLTCGKYEYTTDIKLPEIVGYDFSVTYSDDSKITNVGTVKNKIVKVKEKTIEPHIKVKFSNCVEVSIEDGTLTVKPRKVTITANDAWKYHDGEPLTQPEFTVSGQADSDKHVFDVKMTEDSKITDVGTQPNVIASVDGVAVQPGVEKQIGNYLVTVVSGTLEVEARQEIAPKPGPEPQPEPVPPQPDPGDPEPEPAPQPKPEPLPDAQSTIEEATEEIEDPEQPRGVILAQLVSVDSNALDLTWFKQNNVAGYAIWLAPCDDSTMPLYAIVFGEDITHLRIDGLKRGMSYKAKVQGWIWADKRAWGTILDPETARIIYPNAEGKAEIEEHQKDGRKMLCVLDASPEVHCYTNNGDSIHVNPSGVTVKYPTMTVRVGNLEKIKPTVHKASNGKFCSHVNEIRYMSSDPKIATVSSSGKVTGRSGGTCVVYTYTINGLYATTTVYVDPSPFKISFKNVDTKMENQSTQDLSDKIAVSPKGTWLETSLSWQSTNTKVLTVDEHGKVTAVGKGNAYIIATYISPTGKKVSTKVSIRGK